MIHMQTTPTHSYTLNTRLGMGTMATGMPYFIYPPHNSVSTAVDVGYVYILF
jgi:hypothetical protein